MISGSVVFYKIATTCLIILVGYIVTRMQLIPEKSVPVLSKYTLWVAFPAYMVYSLPASISLATLHLYWFFPLVGFVLVLLSDLTAYAAARLLAGPQDRATVRILAGIPNWVFMALAVCEPIFREEGVRVVLLFNIGITPYLWTIGMSSFRPGEGFYRLARSLFVNMQSIAVAIGIVLALTCPFLRGLERLPAVELARLPLALGLLTPVWETVYLLGLTALPLSIFQIGVMLGGLHGDATQPADPAAKSDFLWLAILAFLRLLAIPCLLMFALALALKCGLPFSGNEFTIAVIIMAMPPAVAAMAVADVYHGNTRLTAKSLLWLSMAALATAPMVVWAAETLHGRLFPGM